MAEAETPTLPEQDAYAPNDIALALFGKDGAFQGGKRVRAYLRANYTRAPELKNKSWTLRPATARKVFDHFVHEQTSEADAV